MTKKKTTKGKTIAPGGKLGAAELEVWVPPISVTVNSETETSTAFGSRAVRRSIDVRGFVEIREELERLGAFLASQIGGSSARGNATIVVLWNDDGPQPPGQDRGNPDLELRCPELT